MIFYAYNLKDFTLETSDRDIYNDIRAKCDVTEILTVRPDATPEYFTTIEQREFYREDDGVLEVSETGQIVVTVPSDYTEIAWLGIVEYGGTPETLFGWSQAACEALGGDFLNGSPSRCFLPSSLAEMTAEIIDWSDTSVTVEVVNTGNFPIRCHATVSYLALTPETRYIKLRSIDEDSISKYGRRVMDLAWPLGITPEMMQSLIDNYCSKHSEPVCLASMTLEGDTDAKITQILDMDIDDKHQIIHPGLDMDQEFFVNNLNVTFNREGGGILTGTFGLEQVRDIEDVTLFRLDISELDGVHVLA